jgi:hypothetical protein
MIFKNTCFLFLFNISFLYQVGHICFVFHALYLSLSLFKISTNLSVMIFSRSALAEWGDGQKHFSQWPQPAVGGSVGVTYMSAGNNGRNCTYILRYVLVIISHIV